MMSLRPHIKIAFFYFFIAAALGVVLRSFRIFEIPATYKFLVHTHSHIALLGWVYLALTTLIIMLFIQNPTKDKGYGKIFWFTQLTLVGMLLTFPFEGYALFSIVFSTLFLFASYWFTWYFLKRTPPALKKTNSYKCLRTALWYLVLSSLGPWALGAIMNVLGPESVWYRLAIYFYLHFLYNGWMIMALIGLFFYVMERHQIEMADKLFKRFFWSYNLGIILSFFLSTLFAHPPILFNVMGGSGALLQLLAFAIMWQSFTSFRKRTGSIFPPFQKGLLQTIIGLLGIKMLLQLLTALPYFAGLAATVLDFTIGYLHWTFLGVVTLSLFLFLNYFGLLKIPKKAYFLYLLGFFAMEALIFYKGIAAWQGLKLFPGYFEALAVGSFLLVLALLILLGANMKILRRV